MGQNIQNHCYGSFILQEAQMLQMNNLAAM